MQTIEASTTAAAKERGADSLITYSAGLFCRNPLLRTEEKMCIDSPREGFSVGFEQVESATPSIVNSPVARTREYLTVAEALMATARKSSRHGHRDATMILIAYRHGLRASELCDLH